MVKNTGGGNKAKGQGRKFVNDSKQQKALRISECQFEVYAHVSKLNGNGMLDVDCIDNKSRLCFIRGKFRGRGKKDNFVGVGSWILVGLREYESGGGKGKKENCDLLEVYNDFDKEKLKSTVNVDWSPFIAKDNKITNQDTKGDEVNFHSEKSSDYNDILMMSQLGGNKSSSIAAASAEVEEINVDDI